MSIEGQAIWSKYNDILTEFFDNSYAIRSFTDFQKYNNTIEQICSNATISSVKCIEIILYLYCIELALNPQARNLFNPISNKLYLKFKDECPEDKLTMLEYVSSLNPENFKYAFEGALYDYYQRLPSIIGNLQSLQNSRQPVELKELLHGVRPVKSNDLSLKPGPIPNHFSINRFSN